MNVVTLVSYLQANGIAVIGTDGYEEQTTIKINRGLSVLHHGVDAQVVVHGDPPKFRPMERTYLGVVAGVKAEMPKRGTMAPGVMA